MKKRFLITALFLISLSCSFIFMNVMKEPGLIAALFDTPFFSESFEDENHPLSAKNYEMLNNTEKKAYINILNKIREHPEYIRIPNLTTTEFNNVFFAVKNDNPDVLCFSDSCNMISFLNSSFIRMDYMNDKSECDNMMIELDEITDEIINKMNAETDIEKELYIHDYIVLNCEYNDTSNASSAYGCLIENNAICSGYSRAAMILLNKAGIETMVISGTGITAEKEQISHMWNVVFINGEQYHLDVTWDDPVSESDDFISHLFFNLTNKEISEDHIDMSVNVQAVESNYNYFVYNGLMFYNFDKNTASVISEKLCNNINNGMNFIEIRFADDKSYSAAVDKLINSKNPDDELYIIISYLQNNVEDLIDTSHVSFSKDSDRRYIRMMFDKI